MITQGTQNDSITLTATNRAGSLQRYDLQLDQGVFIGASSNCGVRLSRKDASDIHCRIGFEDGALFLQNWISADGTQLNGKTISERVEIQVGDVISIGSYEILVESTSNLRSADSLTDDNIDDVSSETAVSDEPADEGSSEANDAVYQDYTSPLENDQTSHEERLAAEAPATTESVAQPPAAPVDDSPTYTDAPESMDIDADFFDFEEEETYDRETVALLQAEIEDLQAALAQRDADQTSFQAGSADSDREAGQESDAVLQRMQELIDEANRSDERAALMEEMLHAAELANRSDQDERQQLEAWVGDIEKRIGQREDEHAAEIETLRARLEESEQQQQRLQKKLQQAAFNGNAPKQYEETLETLQRTNKELLDKVAVAEKRANSLDQKVEQLSGEQDAALREERAIIAKERAQVSRLRFELSQKLTDIDELPKSENQADKETAHRLQTLRQHLREIHEQEKQEEREAPLTHRLAKLWKRVEF